MKERIVGIGDNVVDVFVNRGMMYPGGNALNVSVYAKMQGIDSAYIGYFGNDRFGMRNRSVLSELGVDISKCEMMDGEHGVAKVNVVNGDRVFIESNKNGALKYQNWNIVDENLDYIRSFKVIHTSLNSYIESKLSLLKQAGSILSFDFSNRFTDDYLTEVCQYCDIACLSCGHLADADATIKELRKVCALGSRIAIGTMGEKGSYVLWNDRVYYQPIVPADVKDTMGAGDSYISAFLVALFINNDLTIVDDLDDAIPNAMRAAASFAAKICGIDGAFSHGERYTE